MWVVATASSPWTSRQKKNFDAKGRQVNAGGDLMTGPTGNYLDREGNEFSNGAMKTLEPRSESDTDDANEDFVDKGPAGPAQNEGNKNRVRKQPRTIFFSWHGKQKNGNRNLYQIWPRLVSLP